MNAATRTVSVRLADGAAGREDKPDAPVWVQVATEGQYDGYSGGGFAFALQTFEAAIRNFKAHPSYDGKTGIVAWDFHHASEMPAASVGTAGAPAQGWVLDLQTRRDASGKVTLWALTRWLEPARSYIKEGRYKWASVSMVLDAIDPVSGRSIGPLLTSVAITNQPFIEGMQQLAASRNALAHSQKGNTMTDLQQRIIERARVLRAETPQPALALSRATAELMPTASNDERHRVWGPLLKQHNLEVARHAVAHGATLAKTPREQLPGSVATSSPSASGDKPTLDVSLQAGPTPFAKLLAHVQASNPGKNYDDCTELAMQLNRTHRIIAA